MPEQALRAGGNLERLSLAFVSSTNVALRKEKRPGKNSRPGFVLEASRTDPVPGEKGGSPVKKMATSCPLS